MTNWAIIGDMKRSQLFLATLALPVDYIMLVIAGTVAYELRFQDFVREIRPVIFELSLNDFLRTLLGMAVVWITLFALAGLYSLRSYLKFTEEVARLFVACSAGLALIIVWFFFNPALFSSRFIVLVAWGLAFLFTTLGRWGLRVFRSFLYKKGLATNSVLLIGQDGSTLELERLFRTQPALGFNVAGRIGPDQINDFAKHAVGIDEVIIGDVALPREATLQVLQFCATHQLGFRYVADMLEAQSNNVVFHTFAGVPLIEIKRTPLDGWGRICKRLFDVVFASILMIVLTPLFFVIGSLIYLAEGRPILVKLERVGDSGKIFKLYKFRTMINGAHLMKENLMPFNERADGPLFKMSADPRITPIGRYLRRTSLDELPQLWNVLKGEMSLVGPRPHEPKEVANYQVHHRKLLNVKPGITGLAQISGRSNLTFSEEAKLDTFYIENWSLFSDFVIIVKTLFVVVQRRAAV